MSAGRRAGRIAAGALSPAEVQVMEYVQAANGLTLGQACRLLRLPPKLAKPILTGLVDRGHLRVVYDGEIAPRERWVK